MSVYVCIRICAGSGSKLPHLTRNAVGREAADFRKTATQQKEAVLDVPSTRDAALSSVCCCHLLSAQEGVLQQKLCLSHGRSEQAEVAKAKAGLKEAAADLMKLRAWNLAASSFLLRGPFSAEAGPDPAGFCSGAGVAATLLRLQPEGHRYVTCLAPPSATILPAFAERVWGDFSHDTSPA